MSLFVIQFSGLGPGGVGPFWPFCVRAVEYRQKDRQISFPVISRTSTDTLDLLSFDTFENYGLGKSDNSTTV
jgi:hypothetical protein